MLHPVRLALCVSIAACATACSAGAHEDASSTDEAVSNNEVDTEDLTRAQSCKPGRAPQTANDTLDEVLFEGTGTTGDGRIVPVTYRVRAMSLNLCWQYDSCLRAIEGGIDYDGKRIAFDRAPWSSAMGYGTGRAWLERHNNEHYNPDTVFSITSSLHASLQPDRRTLQGNISPHYPSNPRDGLVFTVHAKKAFCVPSVPAP